MTGLPFAPYEGAEPYIFVSYSRKDTDKIAPWVGRLDGAGYRMWYDRAIPGSTKWAQEIEEHIQCAKYMLLFLSPSAVESEWVRDEITYARKCRLPVCPVYLCHTDLKNGFNILLASFNHCPEGSYAEQYAKKHRFKVAYTD